MIRAPPCSRAIAQAVVSSSSRSIAPHAARGDPEPLLGEPRALQLVAAADAADHRVVAGTRRRSKRIVGCPCG